jgi:hypothetical protein
VALTRGPDVSIVWVDGFEIWRWDNPISPVARQEARALARKIGFKSVAVYDRTGPAEIRTEIPA